MNYAQTETQATCTNSAAATSVSTLDPSGSVSDEVIQSGVKKNKRVKKVNSKKKRRDLHKIQDIYGRFLFVKHIYPKPRFYALVCYSSFLFCKAQ